MVKHSATFKIAFTEGFQDMGEMLALSNLTKLTKRVNCFVFMLVSFDMRTEHTELQNNR